MVLNLSEGEYKRSGHAQGSLHTACGSSNEAQSRVRAAQAWGYVSAPMCEPGLRQLDRVVATLWKLLH